MSECPNCGDKKCKQLVSRLAPHADGYHPEGGRACTECGAIEWAFGEVSTPRRSQPCEPKELPDESGYWWMKDDYDKWFLLEVKRGVAVGLWTGGAKITPVRSQYFPAVPPIVAPREVRDADAELLRNLAHCFSHAGGHGYDSGRRTPKSQDLERIAGRLDKLARLEAAGREEPA